MDIYFILYIVLDFPSGSGVRNPPAVQETQTGTLGWEDPLEEEMATYSSILAGKPHAQGSLAGHNSWGRKRVEHNLATKQQQQMHSIRLL